MVRSLPKLENLIPLLERNLQPLQFNWKLFLQFLHHTVDLVMLKDAACRLSEHLGNLGQFAAMGQEGTSLEKLFLETFASLD